MRIVSRTAALACLLLLVGPAPASEDSPAARGQAAIQAGEWKEAAAIYAGLTEAEPDNAQHWINLGLARRSLDQLEESLQAYARALELTPQSPRAHAGMALTLERAGRIEEALSHLTAFAENGGPPAVLTGNPAFEGLRGHEGFAAVLALAEKNANPCLHGGPYDDFDFWVGDWDVYMGGQKRARNVITKEMNGCIVRERYSNNLGYSGESINYYDPESGRWKQNWVDSAGGVVRYSGEGRGPGVMVMEGANTSARGQTQLARVTWKLLEDGRVHHVIEQSTDGGETWSSFFDGLYSRRAVDPGTVE